MHFFCDTGEGKDFETDTMEGEDLSGWLVPFDQVDEFEEPYLAWNDDMLWSDKWHDYYIFCDWKQEGDIISVQFSKYNY